MPIPFTFRKDEAEAVLTCIKNGKPIEGPWTLDRMLLVAGALYFGAVSHGPSHLDAAELAELGDEYREATEETLFRDIEAAIRYYGKTTMLVEDNEYDQQFDQRCRAILISQDDGSTKVIPLEGFRSP